MSQLLVRNRQRARPARVRPLRRLLVTLLEDLLQLRSYELGVHLVGDAEMTRLNEQFLRQAGTTDVLAFNHAAAAVPAPEREPPPALHGELFVCVPEAVRQARRYRTRWAQELARYLVHGTLHLMGYDDATPAARRRMKRQEDRLLRALRRRARPPPNSRVSRTSRWQPRGEQAGMRNVKVHPLPGPAAQPAGLDEGDARAGKRSLNSGARKSVRQHRRCSVRVGPVLDA